MQSLSYSALDKSQLERVKYLFADEVFGTDAAAFVYEVDKRGLVTGRTKNSDQLSVDRKRHASNTHVKVIAAQEANAIDDFISQAHMSTDALTAFLAKKFSESQLEEVHHE